MHSRAIPDEEQEVDGKQMTLDSMLTPKIPPFMASGLLDHIIELIVAEDKAFQLVDKGPFWRLLKFLKLNLTESAIPHHTKVRDEVMIKAREAQEQMKEDLKHIPSLISMDFDSWTNEHPYLSINFHYINTPVDKPHEWELKNEQAAFAIIEGNHSGANLASILF
ncbi:hypothetical protein JAAARDRAFT_201237 [Jaapia argillacea MUCL 33604]|uniref:Uncharacterized protein n=1 Tax=Jaapia argillacea MUCL 33604 TaxID=933084 RepID=A0A067P588_9AGAM|nr:hypothetical protein JAAARDRAFT_201237 [Jaapia argillacea MUCL 33604]